MSPSCLVKVVAALALCLAVSVLAAPDTSTAVTTATMAYPFAHLDSKNGAVATLVSQRGADAILKVAMQVLQSRFGSVNLPEQSGRYKIKLVGEVQYSLKNLRLSSWSAAAPSSGSKASGGTYLRLVQDGSMQLTISGIRLTLKGDYTWRQRNWPHFHGKGSLTVTPKGGVVSLRVAVLNVDGRPHIQLRDSGVHFDSFDISVHSKFHWIYDIIKFLFKGTIRNALNKALTTRIGEVLEPQVNSALSSIPQIVDYRVGPFRLATDISLAGQPQIDSQRAIFTDLARFAMPANASPHQLCPHVARPFPAPRAPFQSMIELLLDETLLSCALWSLHEQDSFKYTLTPETLPDAVPIKLNTTNWKVFIPPMYERYPDQPMQLDIRTKDAPFTQLTAAQGLVATGPLLLDFSVIQTQGLVHIATLRVDLQGAGQIRLQPAGSESVFFANITELQGTIELEQSDVGQFDMQPLTNFVKFVLPSARTTINSKIADGFVVPHLKGVTLQKPNLVIGDGYAHVQADFSYMPDWLVAMYLTMLF